MTFHPLKQIQNVCDCYSWSATVATSFNTNSKYDGNEICLGLRRLIPIRNIKSAHFIFYVAIKLCCAETTCDTSFKYMSFKPHFGTNKFR